jgi:hypothetical protein
LNDFEFSVFDIYLDERCVCYLDLLLARFIQQKQIDVNIIIPSTKLTEIWKENVKKHQGMF